MSELLIYLLKVNGALLLFCVTYYLALRRLTFYGLNRVVLLAALLFAPLYPLVDVARWFAPAAPLPAELLAYTPNWIALNATGTTTEPALGQWLLVAYWIGVAALGVRLGLQLLSLYRLHRSSRPAEFEGVAYRAVPGPVAPFAFWQTVYLNPAQHTARELPAILCHEQVHVREWHTLDVLLAQVSLLFYWFNPGIWLLRQALHENLEFNTDYRVLQSGLLDNKSYQYSLLHQSVQAQPNSIVSHFNFHLLKTRIAMMNKPRTTRVQAARYLLLLPLAAGLTLWSCAEKAYLPEPASANTNQNQAASMAENALYFIDGVTSTYAAMNQMNPSDIQSVNVIKGRKFMPGFNEDAFTQDFGAVGEKGVMLIITKAGQNSEALRAFNTKYNIVYKAADPEAVKIASDVTKGKKMSVSNLQGKLLIVDGQEVAPEAAKIEDAQVRSVFVLDAEKATAKYGEKGKNGAVLITTK
ncbi:Signal transducer regulating beta-lactamase production, contains metallopeptidase domain [Hymenobacter gelipurpurascens]|uniref:Signal transducer regulating beta-lactamase production, contains metallopeptidase domain n=1 Tax=Hymenobacter gelipurpurascens TaxID=89968 RepID=A0A212UEW1_9BACT|nr:M56 family metallopeptidase [Hymenobacter gelipurpurascens]SNC76671.1 Signal transducer regulating beta-lactamase production, contains metallopeptidase domain [Hymenobacter gelipurpurascens]